MKPPSIRLRFALTSFLGTALILAGLGVYLLRSEQTHFEDMDRAELAGSLQHLAFMARGGQVGEGLGGLVEQVQSMGMGHGALLARFETLDGQVLADTLGFTPPAPAGEGDSLLSWQANGHHYRILAARFRPGDGRVLRAYVAMNIDHHAAFMDLFRTALWTAIGVALLLSLALAALTARWSLAPLKHMRQRVGEISGTHLDLRLDTAPLPPELVGLAEEFNAMLARLDEAFRRLSQFSSDIAHELRTPVSNLMVGTEVMLAQPRSAEDYREVLYANLEELRRLAAMIADMLFLARADNRLVTPQCEAIDLAATARDLAEGFEASAEERGLTLRVSGEGRLQGDRLMLRRALSNLLSNAIRHAQAGSEVVIAIEPADDEMQLYVTNQGATIATEHLPRLFDRFYQADASRQGEGSGLGLAITRSIVEAHGGEIAVESVDGMTRFCLRFPRGG
jgi:two-component system heavy metal sensor histidine kinase CusS